MMLTETKHTRVSSYINFKPRPVQRSFPSGVTLVLKHL